MSKSAQDGEQRGVVSRIDGRFAAQHADDLALIHHVHIAAQRRTRPRVVRDAQALMRGGDGAHLDLAVVLRAVDAGHVVVVEQLAPGAVDEDHQLRHHLVDGRAAQALADGDAVVLHMEGVVDLLRAVVGGFAATGFQLLREVP